MLSKAKHLWLLAEILRSAQNDNFAVRHTKVKRLLRIFELSKNEQRIVLIVMLVLVAFAFIGYERRIHHPPVHLTSAAKPKASPTPAESEDDR